MNIYHLLFLACLLPTTVLGHGYLWKPPSRSSMWKKGFNTPHNYNDNQLFCGGMQHQWFTNKGKCGICGDPYDGPKENEAGGKYAKGIITQTYQKGQEIDVTVKITANHLGWFEFRLCPNNNVQVPATQKCLDQHLLNINGKGTRYNISSDVGDFDLRLRLPDDVTCTQCVLQWKWNTGNSWGTDMETGKSCVGCGPQEQFYGCSDIAITSSDAGNQVVVSTSTEKPKTTSQKTTTTPMPTTTTTPPPTTTIKTTVPTTKTTLPTTTKGTTPPTTKTTTPPTTKTTTLPTTTKVPTTRTTTTELPTTTLPTTILKTSTTKLTAKPTSTTKTTRQTTVVQSTGSGNSSGGQGQNQSGLLPGNSNGQNIKCRGAGAYAKVPGMTRWCDTNCRRNFCPKTHCRCQ